MVDRYRILVVEDEPAVAKGLIYALREEGFDVLHAESASAARAMVRDPSIHLALLDVRLPDGDGFELCRSIRSGGMIIPIIMVTARDEEVDRVIGLEIGADDYVVKPFSVRELLSRIRAQLRRAYGDFARTGTSQTIHVGAVSVDFEAHRAMRGDAEIFFTATEFRLLRILLQNEGATLTREQIIEAVWGPSVFLQDERTVDVHIRHLREKIEVDPSDPQHIRTVRGFGYKLIKNP